MRRSMAVRRGPAVRRGHRQKLLLTTAPSGRCGEGATLLSVELSQAFG